MEMLTAVLLTMMIQAPVQSAQAQQDPPMREIRQRTFQLKDLKVAELGLPEGHKLKTWVMDTEAKRQEGMMFLRDTDFSERQGMIFVFKTAEPLRFWMKNTYVPLDIAYISKGGRINSTYTMKAFDTVTDYSSKGDSMYALEVKEGLFKKLGIKAGDTVTIPAWVKSDEN